MLVHPRFTRAFPAASTLDGSVNALSSTNVVVAPVVVTVAGAAASAVVVVIQNHLHELETEAKATTTGAASVF